MSLRNDVTHVFAVPGERSIIDAVHPETGRSQILGETLAQVQARYPGAVVLRWEDWRQARAAEQDTPIRWESTTREQFDDMLGILPPAAMTAGGFLVGEPCDHSFATGQPRFQGYRIRRGQYVASSRPLTLAEFRREMDQP